MANPQIVIMSHKAFESLEEAAASKPRYEFELTRSSCGEIEGFTLMPTADGFEGLGVKFAPAMCATSRLLATRLARMVGGALSSAVWATQFDPE